MKILLTGGTGLIGRELGKLLCQNGHEITALIRNPASAFLPFPAKCLEWKGGEISPDWLRGIDAIIHLAGEPVAGARWTEKKKQAIRSSRINAANHLFSAAKKLGKECRIKVFLSGSAIGFYGDRGNEFLTETSGPGKGFLEKVCEDWEAAADQFEALGARVVKVRTGVVLASQGGAMDQLLPIFRTNLGGKIGSGRQWMSWIHLTDIARLFSYCLDKEQLSGPVNGTAPEPVTNREFTKELATCLGKIAPFPVPPLALKLAFGESSSIMLASQRVLPEKAKGFSFQFPTLKSALVSVCAPYRDGQRLFLAEQWVPGKPEEVFPFFCDEKNLEKLTPPLLSFHVLGKSTDAIGAGTLIDYRLSIRGVPARWRTLIEEWEPGKRFVDVQLKGPYRKWHHTHEFLPLAGGTLLRDTVLYKLPLGSLGDLLAGWLVAADVKKIFSYRRKVIAGLNF